MGSASRGAGKVRLGLRNHFFKGAARCWHRELGVTNPPGVPDPCRDVELRDVVRGHRGMGGGPWRSFGTE